MQEALDIIDGVDGLSQAMSEYGILYVLLSIFLLVFIAVLVLIFRNYNKQIKTLIESSKVRADENAKLTKELLDSVLKNKDDELDPEYECKKDLIKSYIDINLVFKTICRDTMEKLTADRIGIYVFHNGSISTHGLPFFKMSCIGEWVKYGNSFNKGKAHSELPLHLFSDIIETLYNNGEYFINIANTDPSESLREFIDNPRISFIYILGIYDDNNNLAGFSIAEYKREIDDAFLISELRPGMTSLNNTIDDIIINSDIEHKLSS